MADVRIVFSQLGGPEVLELQPVERANPGSGEVVVRHEAIGLNFIDTYYRSGLYETPLPSGLGSEAAGVVEAVGADVTDFKPGDRVAYSLGPQGAYSSVRTMGSEWLAPIPDAISSDIAAAAMLKGMTTEFLVERCAKVQPGQWALVHAAAGGVGSILCQWLKAVGARVIGHVGSEAKVAIATANGCDHVLTSGFDDLSAEVRRLTDGHGVDVVFDGVGAASFDSSLAATAMLGLVISFGNASGPVRPLSPLELLKAGSLFLTRPRLGDYCPDTASRRQSAARLFEMLQSGAVKISIGQRFPLSQAAQAHQALEARQTSSSTLLIP